MLNIGLKSSNIRYVGITYINNKINHSFKKGAPKGARSFFAGAGAGARSFLKKGTGAGAPLHFMARSGSGSAAPFYQERAHLCSYNRCLVILAEVYYTPAIGSYQRICPNTLQLICILPCVVTPYPCRMRAYTSRKKRCPFTRKLVLSMCMKPIVLITYMVRNASFQQHARYNTAHNNHTLPAVVLWLMLQWAEPAEQTL